MVACKPRGDPGGSACGLTPVGALDCDARCCCVVGNNVWVAELRGGVAVFNALNRELVTRVRVGDESSRVQFKCMALVHGEVWAGSACGDVHIFDAVTNQWKRQLCIAGVGSAAPISSLFFDGRMVVGASGTGRVIQWKPLSRKQVMVYTSPSSVTDVNIFCDLIISGHADGSLRLWDPASGENVTTYENEHTGVTCLLNEPTTATLWVGRANGTISVYSLEANDEHHSSSEPLAFTYKAHMVVGKEAVTSLQAVSGKVLVTTNCRVVAVLGARTHEVLTRVDGAHDAFIYGASRIFVAETVRAWTVGNDGAIRIWDVPGYYVPSQIAPSLTPLEQSKIVESAKCILGAENANLSLRVAAAGSAMSSLREELQEARRELQELRLRVASVDALEKEKEAEVTSSGVRIKELEDEVKRLNKELADANSRTSIAERQSNMIRSDLNNSTLELSKARAEVSAKIIEKADVEQKLSASNTERMNLERQLKEGAEELRHMRGECERLHKIASQGMQPQTPLDFTKVKSSFMPNPPSRTDVDELMKKNAILQALIKSLEYTIRRKEEEERDITSLLNAFRRKVADRVTDPHLRTLLSSVMFRNPERFYTGSKGEADFLQEFNEPLMNYMQELRQSDPDVYKQLIEYLQHPLAGSRNDDVCDKLIALAKQEGDRGENFRSLKRSLPVLLSSLNEAANMGSDYNFEASISRKGAVPGECDTSAFGVSHPLKQCDSPLSVFNSSSGGPANITLRSTTQMPADDKPTVEGEIYNFLKNLQTSGDINVFTAQMAPNGADEAYVRQIRSTFEFILQTRGTLVRQMAILWRRAYKGLQVVKALASSNAREIALSQKSSLKSSVNSSSPRGKSQKLGAVAIGILDELSSLVSSIISTLFTSTEKQRIEFTAL